MQPPSTQNKNRKKNSTGDAKVAEKFKAKATISWKALSGREARPRPRCWVTCFEVHLEIPNNFGHFKNNHKSRSIIHVVIAC